MDKRISDNIDSGLWIRCDSDAVIIAERIGDKMYDLSFHKGEASPIAFISFDNQDDLITAMSTIQPDLRRWNTGKINLDVAVIEAKTRESEKALLWRLQYPVGLVDEMTVAIPCECGGFCDASAVKKVSGDLIKSYWSIFFADRLLDVYTCRVCEYDWYSENRSSLEEIDYSVKYCGLVIEQLVI